MSCSKCSFSACYAAAKRYSDVFKESVFIYKSITGNHNFVQLEYIDLYQKSDIVTIIKHDNSTNDKSN